MRASTLAKTAAAIAATAVSGSVATDPSSSWYRSLRKPRFQPPSSVFPIVWTALYADIALSGAAALDRLEERSQPRERRRYLRALTANLLLNAGWSWLFWRSRRPWIAAAECALLTASSVDLARRTARIEPRSGAALVPYALWCGFATVLTTAIARLNPRA
ncbi:tryptophan-rich sensory protein [Arthrobacter crystallopoietes BAB-32]|uniref:Tryptophan-rich sensory protein n=1 Tax=Arthrobacter crystallopoietes BAB-32 TaxID=1246476 RepID=N1V082_9MICC|nr:TspO/MBR family protein [Arthrobacter crystallopoietes]EMY36061.1 tryptophan-rich sensory protein [Arthrobacter crystallopoietes BAB-32]